ncbi:Hypothetical protein Bdt_2735 [Bdellovibrio bacteriovorus str. Tiberius]|uniref:Uncharacterized protein n=1 Tax=Bdellovibrio bacteriovorus str. Tiberius TaxID=1069642 RepID=K7YRE0_BDEBC|nr:Hypothetical protein Bdt_2735 [Bdellovibrio bacteriovorus str. Tiberius]
MTSLAEEHLALTRVLRGSLELLNQDGRAIEIKDGTIKLEISKPSKLSSPVRWMKNERVVRIQDQENVFEFRIPKSSIKSDGQFLVSSKAAEQRANLSSVVQKSEVNSERLEVVKGCSYFVLVPTPVTHVDGNGNISTTIEMQQQTYSGRQEVLVHAMTWTEQVVMQIYNDEGAVEIKSEPAARNEEVVVRELSDCR